MLRALLVAGALGAAAVGVTSPAGLGFAYADPGQTCTPPQWVTYWTVPIASRTTCFNPDGSYQTCSSLGTAGNGPGTCMSYPAAPAPAGQPTFSPPVPGFPPQP